MFASDDTPFAFVFEYVCLMISLSVGPSAAENLAPLLQIGFVEVLHRLQPYSLNPRFTRI